LVFPDTAAAGLIIHFSNKFLSSKTIICFTSISIWKLLAEHLTPCISRIVIILVSGLCFQYPRFLLDSLNIFRPHVPSLHGILTLNK
jgi:hypothetical protein